jgi:hypothetical protein
MSRGASWALSFLFEDRPSHEAASVLCHVADCREETPIGRAVAPSPVIATRYETVRLPIYSDVP